jgi:hypothetical protein
MSTKLLRNCLSLGFALCAMAAGEDPAWKAKQIAQWTESDAKEFLAQSPWVKAFTPSLKPGGTTSRRMNPGGVGVGPVNVGVSGMGRRMNGGQQRPDSGSDSGSNSGSNGGEPPHLMLRWESALPVRSAEIKAQEKDAPEVDDQHYAIAVYGVPEHFLGGDTKKLEGQLKNDAAIKRDGKKDLKPSGVLIMERTEGPVVLFLFPNSTEISKADRRAEFNAAIGRLVIAQSFFIDEMVWQGKIEL